MTYVILAPILNGSVHGVEIYHRDALPTVTDWQLAIIQVILGVKAMMLLHGKPEDWDSDTRATFTGLAQHNGFGSVEEMLEWEPPTAANIAAFQARFPN